MQRAARAAARGQNDEISHDLAFLGKVSWGSLKCVGLISALFICSQLVFVLVSLLK